MITTLFVVCQAKKALNCITNTKDYFISRSNNIDINKILDNIEKLEVKESRKNEYSF